MTIRRPKKALSYMALFTPDDVNAALAANKAAGNKPGTQKELADAANLSGVVLNRWIRGNRADIKFDTASRLGDALGFSIVGPDGNPLS